MTTSQPISQNFRIVKFVDNTNRCWYYVQKRYMFIFWLITIQKEGFANLEEARQGIQNYLFRKQLNSLSF